MIADTVTLFRMDLLKLRRRPGLMAIALLLAVGSVTVFLGFVVVQHASDPLHVAPAGGIKHFKNITDFLGGNLAIVVGAMFGVTAGAGDAELGVLRDLVATGRSRVALFASRAVAAVPLTLAVLAAALVVVTAVSVVLAGSAHVPSLSEIVRRDASVLGFGASSALVSAGVGTFARSRGPAMVSLITFGVVISQLLLQASVLGSLRVLVPMAAFQRMEGTTTAGLHVSPAVGVAVVVAWAASAVAAGGWRARRLEV